MEAPEEGGGVDEPPAASATSGLDPNPQPVAADAMEDSAAGRAAVAPPDGAVLDDSCSGEAGAADRRQNAGALADAEAHPVKVVVVVEPPDADQAEERVGEGLPAAGPQAPLESEPAADVELGANAEPEGGQPEGEKAVEAVAADEDVLDEALDAFACVVLEAKMAGQWFSSKIFWILFVE